MRTISAAAVAEAVARLCVQANTHLPPDVAAALDRARREEPWPLARETLNLLWDNLELADARQGLVNAFYGLLISKADLYRAIGRF